MRYILKILLVTIIGLFVGNAEAVAPVLDFDTIYGVGTQVPSSFQPEWNSVNANPDARGVIPPNGNLYTLM